MNFFPLGHIISVLYHTASLPWPGKCPYMVDMLYLSLPSCLSSSNTCWNRGTNNSKTNQFYGFGNRCK